MDIIELDVLLLSTTRLRFCTRLSDLTISNVVPLTVVLLQCVDCCELRFEQLEFLCECDSMETIPESVFDSLLYWNWLT